MSNYEDVSFRIRIELMRELDDQISQMNDEDVISASYNNIIEEFYRQKLDEARLLGLQDEISVLTNLQSKSGA